MKKFLVLLILIACTQISAVTIYDIQYTEIAGDGTYPSLYLDQMVTVTGIVTCNNYGGDKFFISSPEGGAWNGVLVYHEAGDLQLGDEIQITAQVTEYYGLTELQYVVNVSVLSTGNPVPEAVEISSNDLNTMEEYEGVLVKVTDAQVVTEPDQYDMYMIDDGSGACQVGISCISLDDYYFELVQGIQYNSITGCGIYSWGSYELTPRYPEDIVLDESELRVSIADIQISEFEQFSVPIQVFAPGDGIELNSFSFNLRYDSSIIQIDDLNINETLLDGTQISWNINTDELNINWQDEIILNNNGILLYMQITPIQQGSTNLDFYDFTLNDEVFHNFQGGQIDFYPLPGVIADELTVIQRPILAIPEITTPGSQFEIICEAPDNTENWNAYLEYEDIEIPLNIIDIQFNANSSLFTLTVECPMPEIYLLYDLTVTADNIETDTAENSVSIIPEFKESYYFIHITDTHLPGHEFFGNDPEGEDYTEMEDLRHVINSINLLNPEFVLLTGDVVNEGELQDFNNRYEYSLAKNLIKETNVPVYIIAGNHDIGGLNDTQPPAGSARHNWHRFFGWEYLENGIDGTYTQNYHFTYDSTLYIGLEAYDNYDSYLYNIFGDSSFTSNQISWLQQVISNSAEQTKVAFYHFDFDDEINLSSLGLDMALWGHIHSNSGDINQHPYNLATRSVCDENRAFRVIYVDDNQLSPQNTCYAFDYPNIEFSYPNNGNYSANTVTVHNDYSLDFDNSMIKFKLASANGYEVNYGNINYIIEKDEYTEVSVNFLLPADESIEINIEPVNQQNDNDIPAAVLMKTYPNPANPDIHIEYYLAESTQTNIDIYNIKGQRIDTILSDLQVSGNHKLTYTAENLSSGIYFIKVQTQNSAAINKVILLK